MKTTEVPVRTDKTMTHPKYANPFSAFRHEMDDLFDKFFASRPAFDFRLPLVEEYTKALSSKKGMIVPDIDIHETKDAIWLRSELPGLTVKDVEITLKDGVLTIYGEKRYEWDKKDDTIHVMECRYGTFQRSFTLPFSVDDTKIKANFKDGVLEVFMPKVEGKKTFEKKIKIN